MRGELNVRTMKIVIAIIGVLWPGFIMVGLIKKIQLRHKWRPAATIRNYVAIQNGE